VELVLRRGGDVGGRGLLPSEHVADRRRWLVLGVGRVRLMYTQSLTGFFGCKLFCREAEHVMSELHPTQFISANGCIVRVADPHNQEQ